LIRILILGSSGMLGAQMVADFNKFNNKDNLKIFNSSRKRSKNKIFFNVFNKKSYKNIEATKPHYIINCIGLIKPKISINSLKSNTECFKINSMFPLYLSNNFKNSKIIHISTDGVFDGFKGNYLETEKPSSTDIYGISKIMGEIKRKNVMNIRCSIIGFEKKTNNSILSWFLKKNSKNINGYKNQFWNGITTHALSKICIGIIRAKLFRNGLFHIFSKNKVTKYKLLCILNEILNNNFKKVKPVNSINPINTTLGTIHSKYILRIWKSSGYKTIPTIKYLIKELI
tara:strand:- start:42 stop:899 length:858 start_codon:yes stop_codon:yes gene_type:complete